MAHLKKLSDRLGMTYKPILKEIVTVGGKNEELLQIPAGRIGNISKKIRQFYIPSLTITAAHNNLACLSAPQIGFSLAAFAIHKNLEDNKWFGYTGSPSDYDVYLNPVIKSIGTVMESKTEECASLPNILADVNRYHKIDAKYMNLEGDEISETLEGFKARVFQNSLDHLWGFLIMNFSVSNGNLREKVQDPDSQFENVLNDFKRKIDQSKSKLEDRYMIDTDFKEKADTAECKEDYYEREIFDQQFEIDFMCALTASIKGRYESNSESESSSEEESSQEEKFEHKNRERKDRRR